MGRLLEPVGNGRSRLMIETGSLLPGQNPAYSFAADIPLSVTEGVVFWLLVVVAVLIVVVVIEGHG